MKSKYQRVMLIDDSEIDNFINLKMIEAEKFSDQVFTQTSGIDALDFLKRSLQTEGDSETLMPQIIFLDINMPVMDGFKFLEEFEKITLERDIQIKVVMLTTSINPADREKSEKFKRIVEFLTKPLTAKMLSGL